MRSKRKGLAIVPPPSPAPSVERLAAPAHRRRELEHAARYLGLLLDDLGDALAAHHRPDPDQRIAVADLRAEAARLEAHLLTLLARMED